MSSKHARNSKTYLGVLLLTLVISALLDPCGYAGTMAGAPGKRDWSKAKSWTGIIQMSRSGSCANGTSSEATDESVMINVRFGTREDEFDDPDQVIWPGTQGTLNARLNRTYRDIELSPSGEARAISLTQETSATHQMEEGSLTIYPEEGTYDLYFDFPEMAEGSETTVSAKGSRTESLALPILDWSAVSGYWEPDFVLPEEGRILSGKRSRRDECSTLTVSWELIANFGGPLKAVAGGPYSTERLGTVELDGSRSQGDVVSWEWTFESAGSCGPTNPDAKKTGSKVQVQALCDLKATLTVSDGSRTDTDQASIKVSARSWQTPFVVLAEGDLSEGSLRPFVNTVSTLPECVKQTLSAQGCLDPVLQPNQWCFEGGWVGGENVCVHDSEGHLIHPAREDGTWRDQAYQLAQVKDPDGPFDQWWYVKDYSAEIARQVLVNPYIKQGGRPSLSGIPSFWDANLACGGDVANYVQAVGDHEREHTRLMEQGLRQKDPAPELERLAFGAGDEMKLRDAADQELQAAATRICLATKDPLPVGFSGTLYAVEQGRGIYVRLDGVEVGGPNNNGIPASKCASAE